MTKQFLISDIILRVTKGAPSDDLELEYSQVAFWFDLVSAEILPTYLNKALRNSMWMSINPILIKTEDNLAASVEDVTMLSDATDRVYIQTTKRPIELQKDAGVIRIITDQGDVVNKVSLENLDTVNNLRFGKPTRENLLYTRVSENKIYIHGLKAKNAKLVLFSVSYIPTVDISSLSDTDEVPLPDEIINTISDEVAKIAKEQLYGGVADIESDAEDDTK